ncbi:hypothetical protein BSKO_01623 [Bryopsis sp. KO-2023]|nr:hypothetical protein BSKO_01623 [Bryopsis sp. KO-2023]
MSLLTFKGHQHFRQRLLCATLSGRGIRIDDIRADEDSPGLRDYEASLLRLIERVSNGCVVDINSSGTSLRYRPGVIVGGGSLTHDCGTSRSIGWFLEPLVLLGLFGKKPLSIVLQGITNDEFDPGLDTWRTVTLPILAKFCDIEDGLECHVVRRGARLGGGGEVKLMVPIVREVPNVRWVDEGMVKRIRGVAYSMKVSPQNTNRMVDGARGMLKGLLGDVHIFTDAVKGKNSGNSPGYGVTLVAETTTEFLISSEAYVMHRDANQDSDEEGQPAELVIPEELGKYAAAGLLDQVERGGVVDGTHQAIVLLLCALGPELLSEVRLGPLTPSAIQMARLLKDFFGVIFDVRPEKEYGTIFMSCVGVGMKNIGRRAT